jgi:hypothetical protein
MEDGGKSSARMHRDVDGEITQFHLAANRAQRPGIGQEH